MILERSISLNHFHYVVGVVVRSGLFSFEVGDFTPYNKKVFGPLHSLQYDYDMHMSVSSYKLVMNSPQLHHFIIHNVNSYCQGLESGLVTGTELIG